MIRVFELLDVLLTLNGFREQKDEPSCLAKNKLMYVDRFLLYFFYLKGLNNSDTIAYRELNLH